MVGVSSGRLCGDGRRAGPRLALEVVGVVRGQHLDLVEPDGRDRRRRRRCSRHRRRRRQSRPPAAAIDRAQATDENRASEPSHRCPPVHLPTSWEYSHVCREPSGADRSASGWSTSRSSSTPRCPARPCSFNQIDTPHRRRASSTRRCPPPTATRCRTRPSSRATSCRPAQYVTVGDDELAALDPEASRTIDIEEFVDLADIDPIFYDSAYYVAPDKATTKPYALLAQAMEESGKVGVARFVMRSKQYLCAIRPEGRRPLLSTMVYADEVNDPTEIAELDDLEDVDAHEEGAGHGAPAHRVAVGRLRRRAASRTPTATRCSTSSSARRPARPRSSPPPEAMSEDKVVDLMAALEASVKEAKAARKRHPAGAAGRRRARRRQPAKKRSPQVGRSADAWRRPGRRDRRAAAQGLQPRQGALPRGRVHQGRGHRLLRAHRAGDARRTSATAASRCGATPTASTPTSFFEKRCPSHRPEWIGTFAGPGDRNGTIGYCRARLGRGAGVGRQHGGARAARADGAWRRHRDADDVRVRPRPGPAHRHPRVRRGGARHPRGARRPGRARVRAPRRRARRACRSTCRSTRPHTHEHCSEFAQAVAQVLEKHHPTRVTSIMAKAAAHGQGLHRLEPEQPPQDDGRPCTRCGPGRARRCPRR